MNWSTRDLSQINALCKNTMMEHLQMVFTSITDEVLEAQMPVQAATHQPMGLLHGGASAALVESIGSMGSALLCDLKKESPVGLEINTNHLAGVRNGKVTGKGRILHQGRKTHVWQVDIHEDLSGKLVATGRITIMILQHESR
jgi:1,4-dihydroxy-2-naphthoyl-CoA hydrolase